MASGITRSPFFFTAHYTRFTGMPRSSKVEYCLICDCLPCECGGKKKQVRRTPKPTAEAVDIIDAQPDPRAVMRAAMRETSQHETVVHQEQGLDPDTEAAVRVLLNADMLATSERKRYAHLINPIKKRAQAWRERRRELWSKTPPVG